jgi:hypothetical protein
MLAGTAEIGGSRMERQEDAFAEQTLSEFGGERARHVLRESNSRPRGRVALAGYTGGVAECLGLYDNVVVSALE